MILLLLTIAGFTGMAAALAGALVARRRRETSLTEDIAALRGSPSPPDIDAAASATSAARPAKLTRIALSA